MSTNTLVLLFVYLVSKRIKTYFVTVFKHIYNFIILADFNSLITQLTVDSGISNALDIFFRKEYGSL